MPSGALNFSTLASCQFVDRKGSNALLLQRCLASVNRAFFREKLFELAEKLNVQMHQSASLYALPTETHSV